MSGLELIDLSPELLLVEFALSVVATIILVIVVVLVGPDPDSSPSSQRPGDRKGWDWEYRLFDAYKAMLNWIEERYGTGAAVMTNLFTLTLLLFIMLVLVTVLMQIMLYPVL